MDHEPTRSSSTDSTCSLKRSNAVYRRGSSLDNIPIPTVEAPEEYFTEELIMSPLSFSPSSSDSDSHYGFDEHSEETLPDELCPPGRMNWDAVIDLPEYIQAWAKIGMTACEIGQNLHRFVYGQDATLSNLVTTGVGSSTPYFEIGNAVMRNLDLRDAEGRLLHEQVPNGDETLRALPEKEKGLDQLAAFAAATSGDTVGGLGSGSPKFEVCAKPKRVRFVEPESPLRSRSASICGAFDDEASYDASGES
ncbi:hypothetical protein P170DRAFT_469997 [Aspergillus steynii IBT 23096]|uniref:Uncharacterized protein n=1 Tax=Aspergillus steynii IBT 23096 TaxID=1392250 RepID=A0A2I2GNU0_9EURO|nr:uncharacterized protein P170DRAFT_469997 [Aspergillus steynii IBT 23096]PLB54536.1 hypothetical protein P170DRAFT_469997 [Aspergillus steynii IBT 23096]